MNVVVMAGVFALAAARPPPDPPSRHQIVFATSDDGLSFTESASPVMLHASRPDAIELSGVGRAGERGWLCVYAVDARGYSGPGTERLCRLVSRDSGKTWGEPEPVSVRGVSGGAPVDPAIVQLPDGRVRMYYMILPTGGTGRDPSDPLWPRPPDPAPQPRSPLIPPEPPTRSPLPARPEDPARQPGPGPRGPGLWPTAIGSALSEDGRSFRAEEGVRLQAPGVADPEVVFCPAAAPGDTAGQWLMFHRAGERILLARSRDGLRFERDGVFELAAAGAPGAAVLLDGRVRVFTVSGDGIASAAYDPRTQRVEPEPGLRVRGPCADPAVVARADGGYIMTVRRTMPVTVP